METILKLGSKPGELGPSTIVGSAAFNLLVISAVSIMAVDTGEIKKVDDMGVFAVTTVASQWAYIWLYICLGVWTPNEITIPEAILTFSFFFALILIAYAADRYRDRQLAKKALKEQQNNPLKKQSSTVALQDFYKVLAKNKHEEKESQPSFENTLIKDEAGNQIKLTDSRHGELVKLLKEAMNVDDISALDSKQIQQVIQKKQLLPRLAFRKRWR